MKTPTERAFYEAPQSQNWTGRKAISGTGNDYWHQKVDLIDLNKYQKNPVITHEKIDFALLGYTCDEGVRRNLGRTGAVNGPKAIRGQLGKLAFHHSKKRITDFGDVTCPDTNLEASHKKLANSISTLLHYGIFPIVLGGGHDISYGHFKGLWKAVKDTPKSKIGIINFDAHFDLRPLVDGANSGTPFYQILEEHRNNTEYFVLGIQEQSNTKELFDIAKKYKVDYILNYDCDDKNFDVVSHQLKAFVQRNDWIYVTIDMDGFSSMYAPGVSAPSPMGFTPYFVIKTLKYIFSFKKVISCDIAELNPRFDQDNATANLAARLVGFIVSAL